MNEQNHLIISVVIPTCNRFEYLKETLESFLAQEKDASFDYEVIVVDNNSKDKTKELVKSYIPKFNGRLRYVFEEKQGAAYSCNRGIKETQGEIVAFINDDAAASSDWLKNIKKTFDSYPGIEGIAGKTLPDLKCKKPKWLSLDGKYILRGPLNYYNYGENDFYITGKDLQFVGTNMALKKSVFEKHGLFYEGIKKINSKPILYEDTELYRRIKGRNEKILYASKVIVKHFFDEARINKRYFKSWYYHSGIATVITEEQKKAKTIFKLPIWVIKKIMLNWLLSAGNYLFFNPIKAFYYEAQLFFNLGQAKGFLIHDKFQPQDWCMPSHPL